MSSPSLRSRLAVRVGLLSLLGSAALGAGAATATAPAAAAAGFAERITLSPTATPATSQTITWRTATSVTTARVEYGPASGGATTTVQGRGTGTAGNGRYHAATLTGLTPGTAYRYRVGDGASWSDWSTFTTASATAEPFAFLYLGDVQNNITAGAAPTIRAAYAAAPHAELTVHAGDLVNNANSDSEWAEWYDAVGAASSSMNHITAPGNHEYSGWNLSSFWNRQFPGAGNGPSDDDLDDTVYHTDYQGVRFVVLNSNYRNAPWFDTTDWLEDQGHWLERVLSDNPNRWTVVTFHHPVFANSPSRDNGPLRSEWLDILEEYDVDLVLQGHDHSYGRGNLVANRTADPAVQTGPVYVVSVTGPKMYDVSDRNWTANGAEARVQVGNTQTYQVVEVDGGELSYESRTLDGTLVDAFTITKDADGDKRVTDGR